MVNHKNFNHNILTCGILLMTCYCNSTEPDDPTAIRVCPVYLSKAMSIYPKPKSWQKRIDGNFKVRAIKKQLNTNKYHGD